jgi:hypothetical protein
MIVTLDPALKVRNYKTVKHSSLLHHGHQNLLKKVLIFLLSNGLAYCIVPTITIKLDSILKIAEFQDC